MAANQNSLLWDALVKRGNADPAALQDFLETHAVGLNLESERSWKRIVIRQVRRGSAIRLLHYTGESPEAFAQALAEALSDPKSEIYLYCGEEEEPRRLSCTGSGYRLSLPAYLPNETAGTGGRVRRLLSGAFGMRPVRGV